MVRSLSERPRITVTRAGDETRQIAISSAPRISASVRETGAAQTRPNTGIAAPVMPLASGEQRKAMTAASSAG